MATKKKAPAKKKSPIYSKAPRLAGLFYFSDRISVDCFDFLFQVIHQNVLAEIHGGREVGLPAADLGHFLHEVDEVVVAGQHEGVDKDSCLTTYRYFFEGLLQNHRIESERILV